MLYFIATFWVSSEYWLYGWAWVMTVVFKVRPHSVNVSLYAWVKKREGEATGYRNGSNRSLADHKHTIVCCMGGSPGRFLIFTDGPIPWLPQMCSRTPQSLCWAPNCTFYSRNSFAQTKPKTAPDCIIFTFKSWLWFMTKPEFLACQLNCNVRSRMQHEYQNRWMF